MKKIKKFLKKKYFLIEPFICFFIFLSTFAIYAHNLSPGVYGGDSGDLITAALAKGVPHPSGYPLFTMLGILLNSLPFDMSPAWKVGLISSISTSISAVLVFLISLHLTKSRLISLITSLTYAFTYTIWLYAEFVEVFPLMNMFILLLTLLTLKFISSREQKYLFLVSFFAGLSLTNNQTIILFLAPMALSVLLVAKSKLLNLRLLVKCAILLFIGLTPYIYIPIVARTHPEINWGRAENLQNFLILVTRQDYGWGLIGNKAGLDVIQKNFGIYLSYWKIYLPIIFPILSLLGFFYLLFKKHYKEFILLSLSAFLTGPFFILYSRSNLQNFGDLAVIEKYYTTSITTILIGFPFGILLLINILKYFFRKARFRGFLSTSSTLLMIIIPISLFVTNLNKTNLSSIKIGDTLGIDILNSLPQNALIILKDDSASFNTRYVHIGLKYRRDIKIIGKQGGIGELLKGILLNDADINNYLSKYRNNIVKEDFEVALLKQLDNGVEIFADSNKLVDKEALNDIVFVPHGLIYKIYQKKDYKINKDDFLKQNNKLISKLSPKMFEDNMILESNLNFNHIRAAYLSSYYNTSNFLSSYYNDNKAASEFYLNSPINKDSRE